MDYLVQKGLYRDSYNGWHDYGSGLEPLKGDDKVKWDAIDQAIKQAYQQYLNYVQYDQLKTSDSNRANQIMSALRYQYIMEVENQQPWYATAVGSSTFAQVSGSVALGANSVADRGKFEQKTIAPFSGVDLAGKTTGAISVGGRPFVYQQNQDGAITVTRGPQLLRQLINLADGTEETDAVNLRQLTAAINSVRNTGGGGDGAAVVVTPVVVTPGDSNIIIGGPDSTTSNGQTVHTYSIKLAPNLTADSFSVNNGPSMTTEGINANNQRISNVAPGRAGTTDAVNMQQLGALQSNVNTLQSNVNRIEHSVRKIRKEMRSIGANSTAIASLPQVMHAGKSQIAMATGVYRDASSVAIGWSHANEKGNTVFKLNGAISSNGDATAGVGFGYEY